MLGEAMEQRSRLPDLAVLSVEFADSLVHVFEADGVRIPHRPAAIGREAIAVEIDNVNVRSAQGVAFFQNAGTFVDKRVKAAIADFVGA